MVEELISYLQDENNTSYKLALARISRLGARMTGRERGQMLLVPNIGKKKEYDIKTIKKSQVAAAQALLHTCAKAGAIALYKKIEK